MMYARPFFKGSIFFPRLQWKLGLVTDLIPGQDTTVKGVKVRLSRSNTIISRPVNKLFLVELF